MEKIDAKTAVRNAVAYVTDMYRDENITDVLLEEIEMNEAETRWRVTLGFARVVQQLNPILVGSLSQIFAPKTERLYKVVEVDCWGGSVHSMKIRDVHGAA